MQLSWKLLFFFLVLLCAVNGTAQDLNAFVLVDGLEQKAADGKLRAIRDLGSLLGGAEDEKVKTAILKRLILRDSTIQTFNGFDREAFLSFYYENERNFQYSPILKAFYAKPLEEWESPVFQIKPDNGLSPSISELLRRHEKGDATALEQLVFKNEEKAFQALQTLLHGRALDSDTFIALIRQGFDESLFDIVVDEVTQNNIEIDAASKLLSDLVFEEHLNLGTLSQKKNEAGSYKDLRLKGYQARMGILPAAFEEQVDFFALVMAETPLDSELWNAAFIDMIGTRHPRALFYLKCNAFLAKKKKETQTVLKLENAIKRLTRLDINIKGDAKQALVYWAKHHTDYDWDKNEGVFINKKLTKELNKSYERLFRRLSAKDGSVALQAYQQLIEGEPKQIIQLNRKYKNVLRSVHPSLPSFRYAYLEQLVKLSNYMQGKGVNLTTPSFLSVHLDRLKADISVKERFQKENELIEKLSFDETTYLELEALIHSKNMPFGYSASRILDRVYGRDWPSILNDLDAFETYLMKSIYFSEIGVLGTCNLYLKRIDFEKESMRKLLSKIKNSTTEEALFKKIEQWLEPDDKQGLPPVFWESVEILNPSDLKNLPSPNPQELEELIGGVFRSEEPNQIRAWMSFLKQKENVAYVPFMMELLSQDGFPEQELKQQMAIQVLEKIYQYSFKKEGKSRLDTKAQWLDLWQLKSNEYKDWGKSFFEQQLEQIKTAASVDSKLLNQLLESEYFEEEYRALMLNSISKLKQKEKVFRLKLKPKMTLKEASQYLGEIEFSYKKLDDIVKILSTEQPNDFLTYLESKMTNYSAFEKGYVYNKLFKQAWFQAFASYTDNQEWRGSITKFLEAYLAKSNFLGEYEEYQLYWRLFALKNGQAPFEVQIKALDKEAVPKGAKVLVLQDLLSKVQFEALGEVLPYYDLMESIEANMANEFLSREFGLPIFFKEDANSRIVFLKDYKQLSKFDLYQKALRDFGLDFLNKKGMLDFNKIDDILRFDAIEPFSNTSGGRRDYYVYGVIKLLELHFDTRLGFHEKLNEDQLFYTYTSQKRAKAWRQFLLENKHIQGSDKTSFYH